MGAPDVLVRLAAAGIHLTRNGDKLVAAPRECLDDDLRVLIREHKAALMASLQETANHEPLTDPLAESWRRRLLSMLSQNPTVTYAVLTEMDGDPEAVLLALAIRGRATCKLHIPKAKYDPFLMLDLLDRHGGTVH